ncbi:acetyl-CoA carboxylase carboxyltransferase subunit alpha [Ferrovibrio sp. MS7]|jgi:acetyl-CoA carboxylase carboxyl transferase subunit alpha|uniref:acetyl-CoA carboxylase carboxyltransferase subunit alpha n=1 Tax=Ferrovibrio plantarum TaxID=3119164 RepID=UPI0031349FA8
MQSYLEFEKPLAELEAKIAELKQLADAGNTDIADELARLETKAAQQLQTTYGKLTPWQKTQVARHQDRPHYADYVAALITEYEPLAGDRAFADDPAIQGGLGRFRGRAVVVMGHEKGRGTEGRVKHNFGMAKPEGYRKAIRLMRLAERFRLPVITLVDTSGAFPGVAAEERGQAEAIARAIDCCLDIRVPMISAIVGEGGSGGAVALAAANRVLMFEHAVYSVISPEGCAAILWNTGEKAQDAAEALKLTAADLMKLKVVDEVVREPIGGAHRDPKGAMAALGDALEQQLRGLVGQEPGNLREQRRRKFLEIGSVGL